VEIRRREPDVQIALRRFTSPWRVTRPRLRSSITSVRLA